MDISRDGTTGYTHLTELLLIVVVVVVAEGANAVNSHSSIAYRDVGRTTCVGGNRRQIRWRTYVTVASPK